jgi:glutaconate CoA-transferase, subunit A
MSIVRESEPPGFIDNSIEFLRPDPDGFRQYVREHKQRALVSKLVDEREAIAGFVEDGDYLVYDCNYLQRGPASLIRELIRQRRRDLWVCAKFTYVDLALLVEAGCVARADVGYFGSQGPMFSRAAEAGGLKFYEYSNAALTLRLRAGSQGVSFIQTRSFGGTDGYRYSAATTITDPYTGGPAVLLPALNPDVALIHVHEADVYGNARVFGTGVAHTETALASKKVILSTERIIDTEEIRRNPGLTSIPWFVVDAVVLAPYGAYPGSCQGVYSSDAEHTAEVFGALRQDRVSEYLEKWVFSVSNHEAMLERRVGLKKLLDLRDRVRIREGYHT